MGRGFSGVMMAGALLACAASAAVARAGLEATAVAALAAGTTGALAALRIHHIHGRRSLTRFYATCALVLGITVAGQGYLQVAAGTGSAGVWLLVAAGIVQLAGAGGALVTSA
ncbi:MAG TPA: hypothetical protein VFQ71_06380 [Gaiellales bacterium]|nr:hypothetical protein [Gaiellales bacterium]